MKTIDNILTPSSFEAKLKIFNGNVFHIRKADMNFDSWCHREFGSLQGFADALQDNENVENLSKAICGGFYQLLCNDGKRFLSSLEGVQIDDYGVERQLSNIEKLFYINEAEEVKEMTMLILKAKGYADPNPSSLSDVKKNKKKTNKKK